jgi:hypothetical protein
MNRRSCFEHEGVNYEVRTQVPRDPRQMPRVTLFRESLVGPGLIELKRGVWIGDRVSFAPGGIPRGVESTVNAVVRTELQS